MYSKYLVVVPMEMFFLWFILSGDLWVARQILQGSELVGSCSSLCILLAAKPVFLVSFDIFHHTFLVANVF